MYLLQMEQILCYYCNSNSLYMESLLQQLLMTTQQMSIQNSWGDTY